MAKKVTRERRQEHHDFSRACLIDRSYSLEGIELLKQFFCIGGATQVWRRGKPWATVELARNMVVPVARVHRALKAGEEAGLIELTEDGWKWKG